MNGSKVHVSLDVNDLEKSIRFYSALFQTLPTKVKPGYAKFDLEEPSINLTIMESQVERVAGPNHMGLRLTELGEVIATKLRLEEAGFTALDEMDVTLLLCGTGQDMDDGPNRIPLGGVHLQGRCRALRAGKGGRM